MVIGIPLTRSFGRPGLAKTGQRCPNPLATVAKSLHSFVFLRAVAPLWRLCQRCGLIQPVGWVERPLRSTSEGRRPWARWKSRPNWLRER